MRGRCGAFLYPPQLHPYRTLERCTHARALLSLSANWIGLLRKSLRLRSFRTLRECYQKRRTWKLSNIYFTRVATWTTVKNLSIKRYLRSHSRTMAAGYSDRATMTRWLWDGQAIHAIARGHRGIIAKCTIDMSIKCLFSIKAHSSLNLGRHQTKDTREHSTSVESDIRLLLYVNFRKFSNFLQKVSKSIWDMEMEMFAHFSSLPYSCFVFVSRCGGGVWWEGVRMLVNSLPPRWFLIKAAD